MKRFLSLPHALIACVLVLLLMYCADAAAVSLRTRVILANLRRNIPIENTGDVYGTLDKMSGRYNVAQVETALIALPYCTVLEHRANHLDCMLQLGLPSLSSTLGDGVMIHLSDRNGSAIVLPSYERPGLNYLLR